MKKVILLALMAITAISCTRVAEVENAMPFKPRFVSNSRSVSIYEIKDTKGSNDFIMVEMFGKITLQPISRVQ